MDNIKTILTEYARLRGMTLDAQTALQVLRPRIHTLSAANQADLVRQIRQMESSGRDPSLMESNPPTEPLPDNLGSRQRSQTEEPPLPGGAAPGSRATGLVRKLAPAVSDLQRAVEQAIPSPESGASPFASPSSTRAGAIQPAPMSLPTSAKSTTHTAAKSIVCEKCSSINPADQVVCRVCGTLLSQSARRGVFDTVMLDDESRSPDEVFRGSVTLVLYMPSTSLAYRLQPQFYEREMIIGRGDGGATLQPDVDLNEQDGAKLGVSRVHLAIHYNADNATVSVTDLRSANGTFINSQRLHPHEVRVLRHGDELRLARLLFQVYFQSDDGSSPGR